MHLRVFFQKLQESWTFMGGKTLSLILKVGHSGLSLMAHFHCLYLLSVGSNTGKLPTGKQKKVPFLNFGRMDFLVQAQLFYGQSITLSVTIIYIIAFSFSIYLLKVTAF